MIRMVNPLSLPDWDALVMSHPDHTVFHCAAWARVLSDTYGFEPVYMVGLERTGTGSEEAETRDAQSSKANVQRSTCNEQEAMGKEEKRRRVSSRGSLGCDRLLGLLPCMEINSLLTGKRGVCLPFTDVCIPLTSDTVAAVTLLKEIIDLGRQRRWRSIECRGRDAFSVSGPASLEFRSHSLDLTPGEERLFAGFDSSVRRAIRKAEKSGVRVQIRHDIDAMRTYYRLHCITRRKHGLPPQPWSFFANLHRHLISKQLGFVAVASLDHDGRRPVAGLVILQFGHGAVYKYGASDMAHQECRATNLAMWMSIRHCAQLGCATLDFGRTSIDNEGLRRFKLGWGATESRLGYLKYSLQTQSYVADHDRAHGWHTRLFRLVPGPVSRILGALLYPHLA